MTPTDDASATRTARLDHLLDDETSRDAGTIGDTATASAIQAAAGTLEADLYRSATGWADPESTPPRPVTRTTPFDIASITKALVGSVLVMQAVDEQLVDWTTPVADLSPLWADRTDQASRRVTLLHLLNHTSGLPEWHPFFKDHPVDPSADRAETARKQVVETIAQTPLEAPPGEHHEYSDLGFILIARILERLFGDDLAALARRRIFRPLELDRTSYVDRLIDDEPIADAVVTEDCPRRGRVVRGTVHDTNTDVIGGVSAHAGVFSTADDLLEFGRHLLAIDRGVEPDHPPVVSRSSLQFAWSDEAGSPVGHHLAGWDTPSGEDSSAGRGFAPDATVGHLGFTGTSIWIERRRGLVSVLLTNRVYPSRDNDNIDDLRIAFQETILPPSNTRS